MRAEGHKRLSTTSKPGSPSYSLSHPSLNMTSHEAGVTSSCHAQEKGNLGNLSKFTGASPSGLNSAPQPPPGKQQHRNTHMGPFPAKLQRASHTVQTVTQYNTMGLWLKLSWP